MVRLSPEKRPLVPFGGPLIARDCGVMGDEGLFGDNRVAN